jgi:MFS family permease
MRLLVLLIIVGITGWMQARPVRQRAGRSPEARKRLLLAGVGLVILGLVIALWLPRKVPETQGSPASLVAIVLLWIVGGGLAYIGGVVLVGATLALRPPDVEVTSESRTTELQ